MDRYDLMLRCLAGQQLPPVPRIAGRTIRLPWGVGPDLLAREWERQHGPWEPGPVAPRLATMGFDHE